MKKSKQFLAYVSIIGILLQSFSITPALAAQSTDATYYAGVDTQIVVAEETTTEEVYVYGLSKDDKAMVLGMLPVEVKATESDFVIENGVLTEYNGPGGVVVIPEGVTAIGSYAFLHNPNRTEITSITLPDSVTKLYDDAFQFCTGVKNIRLSKKGQSFFSWD